MNLIEIIERYKASKRGLSESTKEAYCYEISRFLTSLGIEVDDVTPEHIETYLLGHEWDKRTVNRTLSSLKSFFSFLVKQKIVSKNVMDDIERYRTKATIPSSLSEHELEIIRDACNNILTSTIIEVLSLTGIRRAELLGSNTSSLDLKNRTLKVLGKGNKERFVKIPQSLVPLLNNYLIWRSKIVREGENALFVSKRGERLSENSVNYMHRKLSKLTGIHVYPHKLRHTFGTLAKQKGMSLEQIQKLLGHMQITTTEWYVHVEPEVGEAYDRAFP